VYITDEGLCSLLSIALHLDGEKDVARKYSEVNFCVTSAIPAMLSCHSLEVRAACKAQRALKKSS